MRSFPLIRTKWSNERIMAVLAAVLALYGIPRFIADPGDLLKLSILLGTGLLLDTVANFIRFKRLTCAVSAAVTTLILFDLSPGVPLWGELAALAIALLAGKHIWGGTGRNPVNPAMVGLMFAGLMFQIRFPVFGPSPYLLPALVMSLPFLLFRPFAAAGMAAGLSASLLAVHPFSIAGFAGYGVVLWCCLVVTDPSTTTAKPLAGFAAGLLAGLFPLLAGMTPASLSAGILASNLLSWLADRTIRRTGVHFNLKFGQGLVPSPENTEFIDLAAGILPGKYAGDDLPVSVILGRIDGCKIFGYGGGAFPTARKIRAVMDSGASEKHLIVNGVECDPGLVHDKWLLRHRADEIQNGIALLARCISFASVTIAAKNVSDLAFGKPVRLFRVKDYYPAGEEKSLIKAILSKSVPFGGIPAEMGILVLNVQTVLAISEAVCLNRASGSRYITYANMESRSACVVRIQPGCKVYAAAEEIRRNSADPALKSASTCLLIGGGAMNARMASLDSVADEFVNFIAAGNYPRFRESPLCSRCGLCSAVCPARLDVCRIARFSDEGRTAAARLYHPERCMACGACGTVCLAGRNLPEKVAALREG
jgi:ferredoxin